MNNSTLTFEIYELDGTEESVIDSIYFNKDDFDNIQDDIMKQQYKKEGDTENE